MSEVKDYFAIDLDPDVLLDKVDSYYSELEALGYLEKIQKSYRQYFGQGLIGESSKITPSGSQGEISALSVNSYRSFLRHQFTLITSDRPAFDARPVNTDYKSQAQAMLGNDVLEYYLTHKKLEDVIKDATEKSLYSSEGFVGLRWDSLGGNIYEVDPEDDSPVMTGDIEYRTYSTLDVARDVRKEGKQDWVILTSYENKYELAARFQEHESHILDIDVAGKSNRTYISSYTVNNTDMIPLYTFYHRKSAAVPEGVLAMFVEGEILMEGPLPFKKIDDIPLFRITPATLLNSALGYTQGFDLLGLQEVTDELYTAVVTNNINFATQCIQGPKDADINHYQLVDGMTYIEYDGETPIQPLNLVNSSQETYNLIDMLENRMEKFTGINDVVRGDPSANLRSGNSLALIAAQAIKFNSSLQNSYARLIEDVGTATIAFLQEFATAPQFISVVGIAQKSYIKEFTADDLELISRVEVEVASALSKTTAGRLEIANNLLQQGLIKRPEQYIAVLETGKLEPIIEAEQSELLNIRAENELLRKGEEAHVIAIDNHPLHVQEHKSVINDPAARETPDVITATLTHIAEHIEIWKNTDPAVLMALGIPPLPPPQEPIVPVPPPQGMGGEQGPAGPMAPPESEGLPNQPSLPEVPPGADPVDIQAFAEMNLPQP